MTTTSFKAVYLPLKAACLLVDQTLSTTPNSWWSDPNWIIAFLGAVSLIATVFIYIRQLRVMSRQAEIMDSTLRVTEASVKAAQKGADVAEEAMRKGQKASVYADGVKEFPLENPRTGQIEAWRFFFPWKNSGTTPALRCESHVNVLHLSQAAGIQQGRPLSEGIPEWWPLEDFPAKYHAAFFLGPQQTRDVGPADVPVSLLREVSQGPARLYFYGWIKYEDVFGGKHITRFCLELTGFSGDPGTSPKPSTMYEHWKLFNNADEECEREDALRYATMPAEDRAFLEAGGWTVPKRP